MALLGCKCGQRLKVTSRLAGKVVRCPKCHQLLRLPNADSGVWQKDTNSAVADKPHAPAAPGAHKPKENSAVHVYSAASGHTPLPSAATDAAGVAFDEDVEAPAQATRPKADSGAVKHEMKLAVDEVDQSRVEIHDKDLDLVVWKKGERPAAGGITGIITKPLRLLGKPGQQLADRPLLAAIVAAAAVVILAGALLLVLHHKAAPPPPPDDSAAKPAPPPLTAQQKQDQALETVVNQRGDNIRNIAGAMKTYRTVHDGQYPGKLSELDVRGELKTVVDIAYEYDPPKPGTKTSKEGESRLDSLVRESAVLLKKVKEHREATLAKGEAAPGSIPEVIEFVVFTDGSVRELPSERLAPWPPFVRPLYAREARMRTLVAALLEYRGKHSGALPSKLSELSLPYELLCGVDADYAVAPPAQQQVDRQQILLREVRPEGGVRFAAFSNGSVLGLTEQELQAVETRVVDGVCVTPAETVALQTLRPMLRLENQRFSSIELLLDDKPLLTAAQGQAAAADAPAGEHEIRFRLDGALSKPLRVVCATAMTCAFSFPRHVDLPVVDIDGLLAAMPRPAGVDPRHVVKDGKLVQVKLAGMSVFPCAQHPIQMRADVGTPIHMVDGWIEGDAWAAFGPTEAPLGGQALSRPDPETTGDRKAVGVSPIGRLVQGDVFRADGTVRQYRNLDADAKTRFETVCFVAEPTPALLAWLRPVTPKSAAPPVVAETPGGAPPRMREALEPIEAGAAKTTAAAPPDVSRPAIEKRLDLGAIRADATRLGEPALPHLFAYIERSLAAKAAASAPPTTTAREIPRGGNEAGRGPGPMAGMGPAAAAAPATPAASSAALDTAAIGDALLLAAYYSTAKDIANLGRLANAAAKVPGLADAAVLAMGFAGDAVNLPAIEDLGAQAPRSAPLAFAMIEGQGAPMALRRSLAPLKASDLCEMIESAPPGLGEQCRGNLTLAVGEGCPKLLAEPGAIEALIRFAPGAPAEQGLVAALKVLETPPPAAATPGEGKPAAEEAPAPAPRPSTDASRSETQQGGAAEERVLCALAALRHPPTLAKLADEIGKVSAAQACAVRALCAVDDPSAAAALGKALIVADPAPRALAERALLRIRTDEAIGYVLNRLQTSGADSAFALLLPAIPDDAEHRDAAEKLLQEMWKAAKGPFAQATTAAEGKPAGEPPRRLSAAEEPRADTASAAALATPEDVAAAICARQLYGHALFAALVEDTNHPAFRVRRAAVAAAAHLAALAPAGAEAQTAGQAMLQLLREGLAKRDPAVVVHAPALAAVAANAAVLLPAMYQALAELRAKTDDADAATACARLAETLGEMKDEASKEYLRPLLLHPRMEVRVAAVRALGKLNDVAVLRPLLSHDNAVLRLAAVEVLTAPERNTPGDVFVPLANDPDPNVRLAVFRALAQRQDDSVLRAVPAALRATDPSELFTEAATLVLRRGTAKAFEALAQGIDLTDGDRLARVVALAKTALPAAKEARAQYAAYLLRCMGSSDERVRQLAAQTYVDVVPAAEALSAMKPLIVRQPYGLLGAAARAAAAAGDGKSVSQLGDWYPAAEVQRQRPVCNDPSSDPIARGLQETLLVIGRRGGDDAVRGLRILLSRKIVPAARDTSYTDAQGHAFTGPDAETSAYIRAALRALALSRDPAAVSTISRWATVYNQMFLADVAQALSQCGHLAQEEAVQRLESIVRRGSYADRAVAADALDDIRNHLAAAAPKADTPAG